MIQVCRSSSSLMCQPLYCALSRVCQKARWRTLTLACVMPDQTDMFEQIALVSPFQGALFIVFIMVGSLIIMNMLLGARKTTLFLAQHRGWWVFWWRQSKRWPAASMSRSISTLPSGFSSFLGGWRFVQPLTKDMIDQEGCDENGDNLISEQEFASQNEKLETKSLGILVGEAGSAHSSSASWGGPLCGSGVWQAAVWRRPTFNLWGVLGRRGHAYEICKRHIVFHALSCLSCFISLILITSNECQWYWHLYILVWFGEVCWCCAAPTKPLSRFA